MRSCAMPFSCADARRRSEPQMRDAGTRAGVRSELHEAPPSGMSSRSRGLASWPGGRTMSASQPAAAADEPRGKHPRAEPLARGSRLSGRDVGRTRSSASIIRHEQVPPGSTGPCRNRCHSSGLGDRVGFQSADTRVQRVVCDPGVLPGDPRGSCDLVCPSRPGPSNTCKPACSLPRRAASR